MVGESKGNEARDEPLTKMKTSAMESMLNNLENGNLADAKKQANRHSLTAIKNHLVESGESLESALNTAEYLKGEKEFQAYCDAK